MPYIEVIEPEQAQGQLKEIYDGLINSRGKIAEVHKIQSLNPESIIKHMELYMTVMFGKSPLKRYQREMVAVVVSVNNQCPYCITHHAEALNHFWKDEEKLEKLKADYNTAGLSDVDVALCAYAEQLTTAPHTFDKAYYQQKMTSLGITDRQILDAALVIAYFNFVNRLVLGLGVNLEADQGTGYKYD